MEPVRPRIVQSDNDHLLSKPLPAVRFNHYTLGTRLSLAKVIAEELSWWADQDEQIIGVVFRDLIDRDFGWVLLARDQVGRFRAVEIRHSLGSEPYATFEIRKAIASAIRSVDRVDFGTQGDEPVTPFDVLNVSPGTDPKTLHPYFRELLERPGRAPSRAVVKEIGFWFAPSDRHFINEFQCRHFDQRLWELYLWAVFRDLGFDVKQMEAPDFLCRAPGIEFSVEATTVAPSQAGPLSVHPNPKTPDEMNEFLQGYMPMKFGSSLMSKVNKRDTNGKHYWERQDTAGKPFVIAIADFHKQAEEDQLGSMTFTQSALWPFLYGQRVEWEIAHGRLIIRSFKNASHTYREKTIPSGFFDQPNVENISAVLFSNAGTIAKFDRMGVVAGFAATGHEYLRVGTRFDPDPNAHEGISFAESVADKAYGERWSDEIQVFHNPNARVPLPRVWLSDVAQFYCSVDEDWAIIPDRHVMSSMTVITHITSEGSLEDIPTKTQS